MYLINVQSSKFLKSPIIDIGAGKTPLGVHGVVPWDKEQGDATYMSGVPDETYGTVYSHHCLEHLTFPLVGLRNWWRILKRGGFLCLYLPHRDLYERKPTLPSVFNPDHKTFWLPHTTEPPCTFSLLDAVTASCPGHQLYSLRTLDDGYVRHPLTRDTEGEIHIELITRKPE